MNEAAALLRFLRSNLGLPFTPIIAGGFARDAVLGTKPRDIDVFLLGLTITHSSSGSYVEPGDEAYNSIVTELILSRFSRHFVPHIVEPKSYTSNADGIPSFGPPIAFQFLQWPVQLICTPCRTAEDVVGSFDYDVCQFWLNEDGQPVGLTNDHLAALVHREMHLLHTRTPWSSLRRGVLMADRFGFKFNEADRKRLVEALHAELTT